MTASGIGGTPFVPSSSSGVATIEAESADCRDPIAAFVQLPVFTAAKWRIQQRFKL